MLSKHSFDLNKKYYLTLEDTCKGNNDQKLWRQKWENHLLSIMADFVRRCFISLSNRLHLVVVFVPLQLSRLFVITWKWRGWMATKRRGSTSAKRHKTNTCSARSKGRINITYVEESGTRWRVTFLNMDMFSFNRNVVQCSAKRCSENSWIWKFSVFYHNRFTAWATCEPYAFRPTTQRLSNGIAAALQ